MPARRRCEGGEQRSLGEARKSAPHKFWSLAPRLFARAPPFLARRRWCAAPCVRRAVMATDVARKRAPDPVTVLRGHTCDVQALAFLPDGRLLAGCVAGRWLTRTRCSLADTRTRACCCCHGGSDADGIVKLWDTGVRRATHTVRCGERMRRGAGSRCRAATLQCMPPRTHTRNALTGRARALLSAVCAFRFARSVHSASSGVLGVGAAPGDDHALLTQGRDGTLKRWQARTPGAACFALWHAHKGLG
jgi:hypothetical protein